MEQKIGGVYGLERVFAIVTVSSFLPSFLLLF